MRRISLLFIVFIIALNTYAQKNNTGQKVFWSESFKSAKLPPGWKNVDMSNTNGVEWLVTDQPYPGSYQYQRQATLL